MLVKRSLSKLELFICLFIWISALLYASYCVYEAGKLFDFSNNGDDFSDGWFLGFKKDNADNEWGSWIPVIKLLMPWYLLHIILTEFTRWILIEALPVCYIMVTNLILFHLFGLTIVMFVFLKISLYFFMLSARSYLLIWILNTSYFLFLPFGIFLLTDFIDLKIASSDLYFAIVTFGWVQLKCASFSFEFLKNPSSKLNFNSYLALLGYSYYLPLYFFGPVILYDEFEKGVKRPFEAWTAKHLLFGVLNIFRYIIWMVILDLFLHFFYIHALEYNMLTVKMLGVWHLNGLGYLCAAFFCIKYTAIYGFTRTLTAIEGHNPPPTPGCVFYVYRNSQMWRTFDVGYYQFIKRYIYIPLLNESKSPSRRFYAAAVTFSYVYIWHGTHENIFWWSLLNFIQVSIVEATLSEVSKNRKFQYWLHNHFSENAIIRLTAALYAPLYLFFVFANSYFYVIEGGYYFIIQFLEGSWSLLIIFHVISYCFCVTAIHFSDHFCDKRKNNSYINESLNIKIKN